MNPRRTPQAPLITPPIVTLFDVDLGAEVDFTIKSGQQIIPVEVKYSRLQKPEISRSLHSFIAAYHPEKARVVNLDYSARMQVDKTTVCFTPFHELLNFGIGG